MSENPTNLLMFLEYIKDKYGNKIAFSYNGKSVTYTDFYIDVMNCRNTYFDLFNKKNVLIYANNSYTWVVFYFAIVISNGIAVLSPLDCGEDLSQICEFYDINTVITSKSINSRIENIRYIDINKINSSNSGKQIDVDIDSNCASTILFTSGTTGQSKGVVLSHSNLCSDVVAGISAFHYDENDIILSILPFNHAFGLTCTLLASLYSGVKICFLTDGGFLESLQYYKPTILNLVPEMINMLKKLVESSGNFENITGGNLRKVLCGGSQVDNDTISFFDKHGVFVSNSYGMTECSPGISLNTHEHFRLSSVGKPVDCNKVKIDRISGEILVQGSNVMLGYYKNKSLTKQAIVDNWLHTGDIGKFDSDGFLYIVGKLKNMIALDSGNKVCPEELEKIFLKYQEIDDIMIYGMKNQYGKIFLAAKIFSDHPNKKRISEIIENENKNLPIFKKILKLQIVDTPLKKTKLLKNKRGDV